MSRLVDKLGKSVRKRLDVMLGLPVSGYRKCLHAWLLWFSDRKGSVSKAGRVWLNVPLRCDGLGRVTIGADVGVGYRPAPMFGDGMVRLQARSPSSQIIIGGGVIFSNNVQVIAEKRIVIGERCLIGDAVLIMDSDGHALAANERHDANPVAGEIIIEDNVFVGSRAIILKVVTIGKDSVIGAGSVVVRSIPPGVIAAGNPAKVIRPL
jgi:acetyltransferase-like isoleucine patch superfamily enzyme